VRSQTTLAVVALVALSGCGGDDGDDSSAAPAQAPSASALGKAVDDWADAAKAYWNEFQACGTRAYPTASFFTSCTKAERRAFRRAQQKALGETAGGPAACRATRARLIRVLSRTGASLERAVKGFDDSNDARIKHRPYRGPPPQQLFLRGAQALEGGPAEARKLSREIASGC
jgi:hypothetical protein